MPLAADEVLLYPRRRRYIVSICIGFAGTKIHSCRERSKTQQRTTGLRSSYGFYHYPEPGDRKTQHRTNVWRQFPGFVGNFDTGHRQ